MGVELLRFNNQLTHETMILALDDGIAFMSCGAEGTTEKIKKCEEKTKNSIVCLTVFLSNTVEAHRLHPISHRSECEHVNRVVCVLSRVLDCKILIGCGCN